METKKEKEREKKIVKISKVVERWKEIEEKLATFFFCIYFFLLEGIRLEEMQNKKKERNK